MDQTRKQSSLTFRCAGHPHQGREQRMGYAFNCFGPCCCRTCRRAGWRSSNVFRHGCRIRQSACTVWATDWILQTIKHKCADMLLEVESAKSAAYYAGWCAAEMNDELPSTASLAKAYCSEAYFHAAAENIQIHGGIGFTWEHPAHLYFKRAKSSELLFGDPTYHRELLAQRIGI